MKIRFKKTVTEKIFDMLTEADRELKLGKEIDFIELTQDEWDELRKEHKMQMVDAGLKPLFCGYRIIIAN